MAASLTRRGALLAGAAALAASPGCAFAESDFEREKKQFAMAMESTMFTYETTIAPVKRRLFENIPPGSHILDLGIGTGPNLKYYPQSCSIVGVDPNPYMEDYARAKFRRGIALPATGLTRTFKFIVAPGEMLTETLEESSFDFVVTTLTLCSVDDPSTVLRGIAHVLKPGGKLLFVEHVAAPGATPLGIVQRVLNPLQQKVSDGCHLTRKTAGYIRATEGLVLDSLDSFRVSGLEAVLISPHISGVATKI